MAKFGRSKYGSRKTVVDGITFDSKREAEYYSTLKAMECVGRIRDLELQKEYRLEVGGVLICKYRADFVYWDVASSAQVVVDVKGYRTEVYRLKKKIMKAILGIEIQEA